MSSTDALIAVREAIVRGLSFDEPLVVATGLRPIAEVDPTALTHEELLAEAQKSKNKVAGAMLRVTDRWNSMTVPGQTSDEPRDQALERARQSTIGEPGSLALRLVRCWADVAKEASFLYVTDRRWLVTMTVAAARAWRATPQRAAPSEGIVRDLGNAARQLGTSLANDTALTKGLDERTPSGSPALVVVWSAPRADVTVRASADGVWLAFTDGSGLWLRPGRPEWPLAQRIDALRAADVEIAPA
ncbi:MAG: hypothetical protein M3070_08625 [Actinomycetota bacterium]|nr:hypothetical protein [Actinomycetota bacterium]